MSNLSEQDIRRIIREELEAHEKRMRGPVYFGPAEGDFFERHKHEKPGTPIKVKSLKDLTEC